jgi:hypothetical protein
MHKALVSIRIEKRLFFLPSNHIIQSGAACASSYDDRVRSVGLSRPEYHATKPKGEYVKQGLF